MVIREERKGIELKFSELCSKIAEQEGLRLYDLDYINGSQTLRIFIIDPSTKTAVLDDCVKMDRAMTTSIEELEWMPSELILEVSSPGLFRNFTSVEHFSDAHGETISLTIKSKLDELTFPGLPKKLKGQKKFMAQLVSSDEAGIEVKVEDYNLNLKYIDIKKANLETVLKHD